jgi:hypothetical protein
MPAQLRGTGTTRRIDKTKGICAETDISPTDEGQRDIRVKDKIELIISQ